MKTSRLGINSCLRVSSALIVSGLLVEMASLFWFHPLSFVLFAFVSVCLVGLGVLLYLASLVFAASPQTENHAQSPEAGK